MMKYYNISNVGLERDYIILTVDGNDYRIDLKEHSKRLSDTGNKIRNNYVISPTGYGIHWPDVDEDLSIDGLIGIKSRTKKDRRLVGRK